MKRERRQPTRAELASITNRRNVDYKTRWTETRERLWLKIIQYVKKPAI